MPARLFCVGPAEDRLRYALESPEHQGSEGCVYRATFRPSMGVVEEVAVKVLVSPHVYLDRKLLRRLRGLQHPHLVGIRDVFTGPAPPGLEAEFGGRQAEFVIMDWVEGRSLREFARIDPHAPSATSSSSQRLSTICTSGQ